jgi:hypothetical protein
MAKKQKRTKQIANFFIGLVSVLVSMAVGSGMIQKVLIIPGIPAIITQVAGWIVVVGAILSVISLMFSNEN